MTQTREIHVAKSGSDQASGASEAPLLTVQAAADRAQPGDTVTIHEGVYREQVDPPRGGVSDEQRITYRAAEGERVAIKGSEVIRDWVHLEGGVWMVTIPNDAFGFFNPYSNLIAGAWFFPQGRQHHTGAVYLNDRQFIEVAKLEELFDIHASENRWFCKSGVTHTRIWANFSDANPNEELVEINWRQTVFYPSKPGINYITVRGLTLSQAATPWAPPTTEQIGLIGVNWSKGWVIEENTIKHSRCTGLTLGKYHERLDGGLEYNYNAHYQVVKHVIERGDWTRENIGGHLIRNNHISHCEQAGIVGSHGGSFSTITGNVIHDIHVTRLFGGFEQAGIKLHAPVDTVISRNKIYRCNMGIWLDWMNQGSRISGNLMYDNNDWDVFMEISHGPALVDNNVLMSKISVLDSAQGTAYAHNLFGGKVRRRIETYRATQYFEPHSTALAGESTVGDGDDRYLNNLVAHADGLTAFDDNTDEMRLEGNLYLGRAKPGRWEEDVERVERADTYHAIVEEEGETYLEMALDSAWKKLGSRELIRTENLGEAAVPKQRFDHPDGSDLSIDTDYFGRPRTEGDLSAGPFELDASTDRLRVWPPDDSVRIVTATSFAQEEIEIEPR